MQEPNSSLSLKKTMPKNNDGLIQQPGFSDLDETQTHFIPSPPLPSSSTELLPDANNMALSNPLGRPSSSPAVLQKASHYSGDASLIRENGLSKRKGRWDRNSSSSEGTSDESDGDGFDDELAVEVASGMVASADFYFELSRNFWDLLETASHTSTDESSLIQALRHGLADWFRRWYLYTPAVAGESEDQARKRHNKDTFRITINVCKMVLLGLAVYGQFKGFGKAAGEGAALVFPPHHHDGVIENVANYNSTFWNMLLAGVCYLIFYEYDFAEWRANIRDVPGSTVSSVRDRARYFQYVFSGTLGASAAGYNGLLTLLACGQNAICMTLQSSLSFVSNLPIGFVTSLWGRAALQRMLDVRLIVEGNIHRTRRLSCILDRLSAQKFLALYKAALYLLRYPMEVKCQLIDEMTYDGAIAHFQLLEKIDQVYMVRVMTEILAIETPSHLSMALQHGISSISSVAAVVPYFAFSQQKLFHYLPSQYAITCVLAMLIAGSKFLPFYAALLLPIFNLFNIALLSKSFLALDSWLMVIGQFILISLRFALAGLSGLALYNNAFVGMEPFNSELATALAFVSLVDAAALNLIGGNGAIQRCTQPFQNHRENRHKYLLGGLQAYLEKHPNISARIQFNEETCRAEFVSPLYAALVGPEARALLIDWEVDYLQDRCRTYHARYEKVQRAYVDANLRAQLEQESPARMREQHQNHQQRLEQLEEISKECGNELKERARYICNTYRSLREDLLTTEGVITRFPEDLRNLPQNVVQTARGWVHRAAMYLPNNHRSDYQEIPLMDLADVPHPASGQPDDSFEPFDDDRESLLAQPPSSSGRSWCDWWSSSPTRSRPLAGASFTALNEESHLLAPQPASSRFNSSSP